jgi:hypothetical protein
VHLVSVLLCVAACHLYSALVFLLGTNDITILTAVCVTRLIKVCYVKQGQGSLSNLELHFHTHCLLQLYTGTYTLSINFVTQGLRE